MEFAGLKREEGRAGETKISLMHFSVRNLLNFCHFHSARLQKQLFVWLLDLRTCVRALGRGVNATVGITYCPKRGQRCHLVDQTMYCI
uniref:Uncharacterized protein n=1 Tax=Seriola lalandi dorsalis TaxID=1841481 RepID=A0A3B4XAP0_SERLL